MTRTLWTPADIGKALDGRRGSLVMLWYNRGKLPEPLFRTGAGMCLWSGPQAKAIIAERRAYLERMERRAEELERAVNLVARWEA